MLNNPEDRSRLIMTHARWDSTNSPAILEWLQLAAQEPRFRLTVRRALRADPRDVVLLRLEQDTSEGEKHQAVCERHRAAGRVERRAEPDFQYLRIRCIGRQPRRRTRSSCAAQREMAEQPVADAGRRRDPCRARRLPEAQPLYEKALAAPAGDARIPDARHRATAPSQFRGRQRETHDLLKKSEHLEMFMSIESGHGLEDTPIQSYVLLARGNLEAAVRQANQVGDSRVLRMVASSDGASRNDGRSAGVAPRRIR